jgi:hypothetical protein
MSGPARYEWTHGIEATDSDHYEGKWYKRKKRVSVTFRTVIPEYLVEVLIAIVNLIIKNREEVDIYINKQSLQK